MNRLANESSLYLRQHANNPVDWYPWGPEALARARQLDRPIFLSVGYSACHWCHVMEHESFEDAGIAAFLNDHFVSIKIDREERPDLDAIYMAAVQALNKGQGGWPMSVFLTPDLKPFYAGTYFPPEGRYGRPGFRQVLAAVDQAWRDRRAAVAHSAEQITDHLRAHGELQPKPGELGPDLLRGAVRRLRQVFDSTNGGFGFAPKFPHAMDVRALLRAWKRFGADDALDMARLTLDKMARGGIYDHLGGGFHRYSVDAFWLVPHFEKMLYDNALLTSAYLEAFQATADPFYRRVATETLDYVLREMTGPSGGFYSTEDADSEGEEGKFYVWTKAEIDRVLGPELADLFEDVYDVTEDGNWEGHTILHRARTDDQEARLHKIDVGDLRAKLAAARAKLAAARAGRVRPGRDEKILTAWNGIMIAAFAQAGAVLDEPRYTEAAARAADFLLRRLRTPEGRLLRTCGEDAPAKLSGYLEDYSFLIDALVSVYEATFEPRWLTAATALADVMVAEFHDPKEGGFFFTGVHHEELITRTKDQHDGSTPSGNAMAVTALLRLAKLTDRRDLEGTAVATLKLFRGVMAEQPTAAGQFLIALDFRLGPVQEFAVIGDPGGEGVRRVLRAIYGGFRPDKVVALRSADDEAAAAAVPLLRDRPAKGAVTTYVCENFACQAPIVGAEALEQRMTNDPPMTHQ
jgi:uncharacterized protein YyaL (SSP411 family)